MSSNLKQFPKNPRFWGPCRISEAADLVEDVLNDPDTEEALRLFAIGEIEAPELGFRIQMAFEAFDQRRNAPQEREYEKEQA